MQIEEHKIHRFSVQESELVAALSEDGQLMLTSWNDDRSAGASFQIVALKAPHTTKIAVVGSQSINGRRLEDLILEFGSSVYQPLLTTLAYVEKFSEFLESKLGAEESAQNEQVKLLTESYCDDLLEGYREHAPDCNFASVISSDARPTIIEQAEELLWRWTKAEIDIAFAEISLEAMIESHGKTVLIALVGAAGERGLTETEIAVLDSMVFCRLRSGGFSSIKTSLCFVSTESDGHLRMLKMDTDGVYAGRLKASIELMREMPWSARSQTHLH